MKQQSRFHVFCFLFVLFFSFWRGGSRQAVSQEITPSYLNLNLPLEERVEGLLSEMTLEEKITQMGDNSKAIERLGIPEYGWWNECLHGVAAAGIATVFPQAIGLGATWDADLVHRLAVVTSDEARAKHHDAVRKNDRRNYRGLTFWSPNINIFRDPRWGRGQETYGEDPFLTGCLGVEFVKGLQGDHPGYLKLVSTPKHYAVHSGPEPLRHRFNAIADERDLRMTYLPAFKACVQEANAQSIMCAYNRYNDEPCCAHKYLLEDILRKGWGFDGYVVSDCGAIANIHKDHKVVKTQPEAVALGIKGGCDLNCGDAYTSSLLRAVEGGLVAEEDIDKSLRRLLRAKFQLGMFDPPEMVPYAQIPFDMVDCKAHRELALEAARKSVVLLKNEKNFLPLSKNIKTIAVIGPNADHINVLLGNYHGTPSKAVTPLEGIKNKASSSTRILYARGCNISNRNVFKPVPAECFSLDEEGKEKGLKAEYFNNMKLEGESVVTLTDKSIDFDWGYDSPAPGVNADQFSIRWTGYLTPPISGEYIIGITNDDGMKLYIDNDPVIVDWKDHSVRTTHKNIILEKGRPYEIKVEYYENSLNAVAKLSWASPDWDPMLEAVRNALAADVIIAVMGISGEIEGETYDKKDTDLPSIQKDLLDLLYQTGKPIILVLLNGSPLSIKKEDERFPAILEAWYPGEEGGNAIADVLFGDYNPAGRLPVTFCESLDQVPDFENYSMKGRTYRYLKEEPLYPFGYGLSYARFRYSALKIEPKNPQAGDVIKVSVCVKNTGRVPGEEVAQLYFSDLEASAPVPQRQLAGFQRIHLKPGEKKIVTFYMNPKQLAFWDDSGKWLVEPGDFEISVGGCLPSRKFEKRSGSKVLVKKIKMNGNKVYFDD